MCFQGRKRRKKKVKETFSGTEVSMARWLLEVGHWEFLLHAHLVLGWENDGPMTLSLLLAMLSWRASNTFQKARFSPPWTPTEHFVLPFLSCSSLQLKVEVMRVKRKLVPWLRSQGMNMDTNLDAEHLRTTAWFYTQSDWKCLLSPFLLILGVERGSKHGPTLANGLSLGHWDLIASEKVYLHPLHN